VQPPGSVSSVCAAFHNSILDFHSGRDTGQIVGKQLIPEAGDIAEMAKYWKTYYNTAG
jgi:hypothetical protein